MLASIPCRARSWLYDSLAYWLPRSEWCTSFDAGARQLKAFRSALSTSSVRMWLAIDQPTIIRVARSMIAARYTQPAAVGT
jgi:hypothetical protein